MKPLKFLFIFVILLLASCEGFPGIVITPGGGNNKDTIAGGSDTLPVAQYGLEYLYDMATLAHITLTVTESDWNDFLSYYHASEYLCYLNQRFHLLFHT